MKGLKQCVAFERFKIPKYVDDFYKKLLLNIDFIQRLQNDNTYSIFLSDFNRSIQSLLFYVKYSAAEFSGALSDSPDFLFIREKNEKERLKLMNEDISFRRFVLKLHGGNIFFDKLDVENSFQLYILFYYGSLMPRRDDIKKEFEFFDYYLEKKKVLEIEDIPLRLRLLKDLIKSAKSVKKSYKDICDPKTNRIRFMDYGFVLKGTVSNKSGLYLFAKEIVIPKPKVFSPLEVSSLSKNGVYVFVTKNNYWYVGQSRDVSKRFYNHKKKLAENLKHYNKCVAALIVKDEIDRVYFVELNPEDCLNDLYEAAIQIIIMGELNKLSELEGLLTLSDVNSVIKKIET